MDLHAKLLTTANDLVGTAIEEYDGKEAFNLYIYLLNLEQALETQLYNDPQVGKFALKNAQLARYLWVCIALAEGSSSYPDTFRNMIVLD